MKNKLLALAVLVLLLLISCSTAKMTHKQVRTDSLRIDRHDSTHLLEMLHTHERVAIRLQHLILSKPDSAGRQYLESVTTGSAEKSHKIERKTDRIQATYQQLRKDTHELLEKTSTPQKTKQMTGWILFLLLFLGVFFFRRKNGTF